MGVMPTAILGRMVSISIRHRWREIGIYRCVGLRLS